MNTKDLGDGLVRLTPSNGKRIADATGRTYSEVVCKEEKTDRFKEVEA